MPAYPSINFINVRFIILISRFKITIVPMSRDSSVGIATDYGLDDHGGWEFESR
jgi:hypothetical protein